MSRRRLVGTMVNVLYAGIIIGILCMIQPWWFALFPPWVPDIAGVHGGLLS